MAPSPWGQPTLGPRHREALPHASGGIWASPALSHLNFYKRL